MFSNLRYLDSQVNDLECGFDGYTLAYRLDETPAAWMGEFWGSMGGSP